jgi:ketosteroid isomerase-like protein
VSSPEQVPIAFAAALNGGQLQPAALCFAPDACLVSPDATAIYGRGEIGGLLAQMIDRRSRIDIEFSTVVLAGDVAFITQCWTLSAAAVAGGRYTQALSPTLILRRLGAEWKLAIAMPWR